MPTSAREFFSGLMGVPMSMPSLLEFIALGGVVVNDSILL